MNVLARMRRAAQDLAGDAESLPYRVQRDLAAQMSAALRGFADEMAAELAAIDEPDLTPPTPRTVELRVGMIGAHGAHVRVFRHGYQGAAFMDREVLDALCGPLTGVREGDRVRLHVEPLSRSRP